MWGRQRAAGSPADPLACLVTTRDHGEIWIQISNTRASSSQCVPRQKEVALASRAVRRTAERVRDGLGARAVPVTRPCCAPPGHRTGPASLPRAPSVTAAAAPAETEPGARRPASWPTELASAPPGGGAVLRESDARDRACPADGSTTRPLLDFFLFCCVPLELGRRRPGMRADISASRSPRAPGAGGELHGGPAGAADRERPPTRRGPGSLQLASVTPASSLTSRHWPSEPDIRAGANRIMAAGRRSPAQRGTDRDSRDFSYSYPSKTTSPVEQRRR